MIKKARRTLRRLLHKDHELMIKETKGQKLVPVLLCFKKVAILRKSVYDKEIMKTQ